jgi:hypothetical protein
MSNLLALGFPTISKTGTSAEDVVEYSLYDFLQGSLAQSQVNQAEKNRQSEMRKVVVPEPEEFDFSKVGVDGATMQTSTSESIAPRIISSFSVHATNQAITRGFKTGDINNIVAQGKAVYAQGRYGSQWHYMKNGNTVIVNAKTNRVITVFSSNSGTKKGQNAGQFNN